MCHRVVLSPMAQLLQLLKLTALQQQSQLGWLMRRSRQPSRQHSSMPGGATKPMHGAKMSSNLSAGRAAGEQPALLRQLVRQADPPSACLTAGLPAMRCSSPVGM